MPSRQAYGVLCIVTAMSNRRTFTSLCLGAVALVALTSASVRAENIITTLQRVADLPVSGAGSTQTERESYSPRAPRGGLLQIGNELWFMTSDGGEYIDTGAIVSYNLQTKLFTTQHSFGLSDPSNPATARYDGYDPEKTTLVRAPDGTVYYAAKYGGGDPRVAADKTNGGVIGSFNPSTVQSQGVNAVWFASAQNFMPRNLAYSTPIFIPTAGGGASIYFNTYAGGATTNPTTDLGTVQKLTLDISGNLVSQTQVVTLTGPNGKQTQGGLLQVGSKLYFATGTAASASPTLQVIDTANNDAVTVLSTTWTTGGNSGGWSKPIYDEERNAIYSLTLGSATQGGILKWDIQTSQQSILLNSRDGSGGNFADPILLGDSIYYVKQSSGSGDNSGGQLWRYDLDTSTLMLLYNLKDYLGKASSQSGSLSKVVENGVESLYFLTAEDTNGSNMGALFKLSVTPAPEPGSALLFAVGGLLVGFRRIRRAS